MLHLAQVQAAAESLELRAQIGEAACHIASLSSQGIDVVDGVVLPVERFVQHCHQANIPSHLPTDQSLQNFADNCQADIRQVSLESWLSQFFPLWETITDSYPIVIIRPSLTADLPIAANDLLLPQIGAIDELPTMLQTFWAEVYCARNLQYWSKYHPDLSQIPLATIIQPLSMIEQSGRLWLSDQFAMVERYWGVHWRGHPQDMEVSRAILDRHTEEWQQMHHPPQQLVHTILGNWPRALPTVDPLIVSGNQWLVPHVMPQATTESDEAGATASPSEVELSAPQDWANASPPSPVADTALLKLSQNLWQVFRQPLCVDWQYDKGRLQIQNVSLGEVMPRALHGEASNLDVQITKASGDIGHPNAVDVAVGLMAASGQGLGRAVVLQAHQVLLSELSEHSILVTSHLTPEWLPLIRRVAGVVTEAGGATSHAAVIARSLGIPAIVGVSQATQKIQTGDWLRITAGRIQRISPEQAEVDLLEAKTESASSAASQAPASSESQTKLPLASTTSAQSVAKPFTKTSANPLLHSDLQPLSHHTKTLNQFEITAHAQTQLPTRLLVTMSHLSQLADEDVALSQGIGLLRGEHLLAARLSGCSPWEALSTQDADRLSAVLLQALQSIASAANDRSIWYRFADWRTHELIGMAQFPTEINPALGLHGTFRYQRFPEWLDAELQAIAQLDSAQRSQLRLLLPFVRTVEEVEFCLMRIKALGLDELPCWMMAEVPAIAYALADYAATGISGIVIGLNDLIQLLFGVDREQALMADFFNPSHDQVKPALQSALQQLIVAAQQANLACHVCSVPADAAFVKFLVESGVDGISVDPADLVTVQNILLTMDLDQHRSL